MEEREREGGMNDVGLPPVERQAALASRGLRATHRGTRTVCPRSSGPFYVVTYYIKWVTTSWTHSIISLVVQSHGAYIK